jgi:hypothetical protein
MSTSDCPADMSKRDLEWNYIRAAAPFLEPGERPGVVVAGQVGVDVRLMTAVYVAAIVGLYRLFPLTDSSSLTGSALHRAEHTDVLRVSWTIVAVIAFAIGRCSLSHSRWFVLTNHRLLILRSKLSGDRMPNVLLGGLSPSTRFAWMLSVGRCSATRSDSARRMAARQRVIAGRRSRPGIEALASSLDSGVVAPSRPDAVSEKMARSS